MIADVEQGIVDLLKEKWGNCGSEVSVNEFDINRDFEDLLNTPAISVATETIALKANPDGSINLKPTISVYMVFKNVGKADQRRQGVYPIIVGALQILTNNDLDLEIEPLVPKMGNELYHDALKKLGMIGYRLQFTTEFDVDLLEEKDAISLLSQGLYYYDRTGSVPVEHDIVTHEES